MLENGYDLHQKFLSKMICKIFKVCFLILLFIKCSDEEKKLKDNSTPNILLLVADDAGWADVGYHGSEIKTPNIDRLVKTGVELNQFYAYPTCSPTRASLLTGIYASRFNISGPIAHRSKQVLPLNVNTLPGLLKRNGYATAITGKWHLGLRMENGPAKYGFEYTYGYLHGQIDQYTHKYKNGDRSWYRNSEFVEEKGHATDLIAHEAIKYIKKIRDKSKPFFLYVPYSVPHYPLQEEEKWIEPYKETIKEKSRQLFAASVTHMDFSIGKIIKALEDEGIRENTLIIFLSDNGGELSWAPTFEYDMKHGPYPQMGNNAPLRGSKKTLYEGGIRVPALINWPGKLSPCNIEEVIKVTDIYPTIASLIGIETSGNLRLDGDDIWPILSEGKALAERDLYLRTNDQISYRKGKWKLVHNASKTENIEDELFNIDIDPYEENNLIENYPEIYKLFMNEIEHRVTFENNISGG